MEGEMRALLALSLLSGLLLAQDVTKPSSPTLTQGTHASVNQVMIPAGTKIPIALKNTISTKANHEGDPIYARSTFPVVVNDKIVIPAGTYVQGKISAIRPAGRIKGRA